jgi:hypothetical protein
MLTQFACASAKLGRKWRNQGRAQESEQFSEKQKIIQQVEL